MDLTHNPSPLLRRLAGAGIAAGGVYLTSVAWQDVARTGSFSVLAGYGGPAFGALGLGLVLFKGYRQERIERGEEIGVLEGSALVTPRWWGVIAIGVLAGLVNFGLLSGWW